MPRTYTLEDHEARFWSKVVKGEGCWSWLGYHRKNDGYTGAFKAGGRRMLAYRWAYEYTYGRPRDDYDIDHLCRNHACVRPDHLEAVPHRINMLRGDTVFAKQHQKTHCKRGHPLSGDNLVFYKGHRWCRTCRNYRARRNRLLRTVALRNGSSTPGA